MSDMIKVDLEAATRDQAYWYAGTALGLSIHHNLGLQKIIAAIKTAHEGDTIEVPADLGSSAPAAAPVPVASAEDIPATTKPNGDDDDAYWNQEVEIELSEKDGAQKLLWVAVNGVGLYIPRGKKCKIKRKYVQVLLDARETIYIQHEDGSLSSRDVPANPIQVFG